LVPVADLLTGCKPGWSSTAAMRCLRATWGRVIPPTPEWSAANCCRRVCHHFRVSRRSGELAAVHGQGPPEDDLDLRARAACAAQGCVRIADVRRRRHRERLRAGGTPPVNISWALRGSQVSHPSLLPALSCSRIDFSALPRKAEISGSGSGTPISSAIPVSASQVPHSSK